MAIILWIVIAICCFEISLGTQDYPTYFIEEFCQVGNEIYVFDTHEIGLAGVINATSNPPIHPQKHCYFTIVPPPGKGIAVTFDKIDFRQDAGMCVDYVEINYPAIFSQPTIICRSLRDSRGRDSLYVKGPMRLLYHVSRADSAVPITHETGFSLTYTVVSTGNSGGKDCMESNMFLCNNGRCITNKLICDRWNNCGDNSDENSLLCKLKKKSENSVSAPTFIVIVCGLIFIIVLAGGYIIRRRNLAGGDVESTTPLHEPTVTLPPFQAVHPSGLSICQNPAGPENIALQQSKIVQVEEGFTNPCFPNGIPPNSLVYSQ